MEPPAYTIPSRSCNTVCKNIAHAQDNAILCRTVWDFVREFRGISATMKAKAICKAVRASRMSLTQFY
jgi:hypothetical protein